ncbi:Kif14, partial [Symbiodinium microadriaticum]
MEEGIEGNELESDRKVRKLIRFGLKKRVTSATIMNNTSSRSHAVFVLKVQRILGRNEDGSRESTNAKINLVDLAGSERHKSSDFQGHTFKEGCAINQSLSALALVIKELGEQQQSRVM